MLKNVLVPHESEIMWTYSTHDFNEAEEKNENGEKKEEDTS